MIVFANTSTPRLQYILDFIGREIIGESLAFTTDADVFRKFKGPRINYSKERISDFEFRISNLDLLFERGIKFQLTECFPFRDHKAFFKTSGDFPFDIFAATFYLLSRYEEYLPHRKDIYGRYAHENSLASREGFLHLPLINLWIAQLIESLRAKFPDLIIHQPSFRFIPTYDIDEAYSYRHKQLWRIAGGFMRSAMRGEWSMMREMINVVWGKRKDPYDAFEWMDGLNRRYDLRPIYFFLIASKTARYDKNILSSKKAMQKLVAEHSSRYETGIHPSWQSGDDPAELKLEILRLDHIEGKQIHYSRQHYIRFSLPETFRQLIDLDIESDFSMGYGSINGFRASVASPFYWYDLEKEEQTKLMIYPFCFMDANSFYKQNLSPQEALEELKHFYHVVRSVNGTLITIWHNNFLGTAKKFKGWPEMYEEFVRMVWERQMSNQ